MITQGFEITTPRSLSTHTVVVGSGSGGGVAAFHLAEASVETIVVEEGGYHTRKDFNQREEDMWPMLYRAGGQQTTADGMISVLQGSCYGGGTVINCSDCLPIPGVVLAHWQNLVGTTDWTEKALEASYERVRKNINVRTNAPRLLNRNNKMLMEAAERLGWSSSVMESNRRRCVGSGYCTTGCSYDARLGTNLTYLPWAIEKGASVYTDLRCDRLEPLGKAGYRVHCTVVERGTRKGRLPLTIDCKRIILSASSIHDPAILIRSGLDKGLPQLGKNLSLQPQIGAVSLFEKDQEIIHWRGAPQTVEVTEFDDNTPDHGLGGFRMEGIGGVLGPIMIMLPGFGQDHKRYAAQMRNMSVTLLLVPDQPSGEIGYSWGDDGRVIPDIKYTIKDEWKARAKRGMRKTAELLFEAGATEVAFANQVFAPLKGPAEISRLEEFPMEPGWAGFISAHNQGTCRMGTSADNSVVDQNLKVHTLDNVYVMDASVFPTSAATHTMLPIMLVTDRAVHRMLES